MMGTSVIIIPFLLGLTGNMYCVDTLAPRFSPDLRRENSDVCFGVPGLGFASR